MHVAAVMLQQTALLSDQPSATRARLTVQRVMMEPGKKSIQPILVILILVILVL
jgi:hypothetical protein